MLIPLAVLKHLLEVLYLKKMAKLQRCNYAHTACGIETPASNSARSPLLQVATMLIPLAVLKRIENIQLELSDTEMGLVATMLIPLAVLKLQCLLS